MFIFPERIATYIIAGTFVLGAVCFMVALIALLFSYGLLFIALALFFIMVGGAFGMDK